MALSQTDATARALPSNVVAMMVTIQAARVRTKRDRSNPCLAPQSRGGVKARSSAAVTGADCHRCNLEAEAPKRDRMNRTLRASPGEFGAAKAADCSAASGFGDLARLCTGRS
jgi:hypothetical protein